MPDKSCFVIMPFRDKFDDIYHRIIKPAAEASGFRPVRADEVYSTRPVISDIFEGIINASAIIADASERNPNVNYELGIAHTLRKPTIIIAHEHEDIPFDYRHHRSHVYTLSSSGCSTLAAVLRQSLSTIASEQAGIESLTGRWTGWYKEPDDPEWRPTAHEIVARGGTILAVAYGVANESRSVCAHAEVDGIGKWRLVWTYDSKTILGGYDIADHTGTHIAYFLSGPGGRRLMEGRYFNNRKQQTGHIGSVGEFNCEWVSPSLVYHLAFDKESWPVNRGNRGI